MSAHTYDLDVNGFIIVTGARLADYDACQMVASIITSSYSAYDVSLAHVFVECDRDGDINWMTTRLTLSDRTRAIALGFIV
jgi:hypothetical protein